MGQIVSQIHPDHVCMLFVIEGSDFTLMCQLFPNRNRTDIKRKFKREEKYNPGKYQRKKYKGTCSKEFGVMIDRPYLKCHMEIILW